MPHLLRKLNRKIKVTLSTRIIETPAIQSLVFVSRIGSEVRMLSFTVPVNKLLSGFSGLSSICSAGLSLRLCVVYREGMR